VARLLDRLFASTGIVAAIFVAGTAPAGAEPAPVTGRQATYAAAAEEFGVPESVLLGVSYLESRWDTNAGLPSTAAGFGPMHLTDVAAANTGGSHHDQGSEDPRGDSARSPWHPAAPDAPDLDAPALSTLAAAAELIDADPATLRTDPARNIRGGAALLARYQAELGVHSADPADWYGAVARYSGAPEAGAAKTFADEVFATIRTGAARITDDGHWVSLAARPDLVPNTAALSRLGLATTETGRADCPRELACEWIPAPYGEYLDDEGNTTYGNHDKSDRPRNQKIDYIVIHDTETPYDATLRLVQDVTYVSWQYTLRSADGHIANHLDLKDVGWHAGNWFVNAKSIGLEHEGYAADGAWYTEAMYRTSAKLVRYLAAKYRIPLDRQHILGHDNVPGTVPATVAGMHWDPGPYWDWAHYFELLGAPLDGRGGPRGGLVTIKPDYPTNQPAFTGCETVGEPCAPHGSGSLVLRTQPRADAPQLVDIGLHPDGTPGTMHISDHSSRVETGQTFAVADRRGDWIAVWYLGQKGWFHNPDDAPTAVFGSGLVAKPKPGKASIPVYGRAYPEASAYPAHIPVQAVTPLQYSLPSGQKYAVGLVTGSEYYWAVTFDPANHTVVRGQTRYVQIQFGHRVAFVNAADVDLTGS
jgi:hypothetical protein